MTYSLIANSSAVSRDADGAVIPDAPANLDWQAYQVWLAVPNTPTPAPIPPPPSSISASAFLARFTPTEQGAVWAACIASPALGVGLQTGIADGTIVLTSPVVATWMGGLVAAGAITQDRSTAILTP